MRERDNKNKSTAELPVSAKDKTFGEKRYDALFGTFINFWVNLTVSAGFSFWVAHSHNPVKLPFMKVARPLREVQHDLGVALSNTWLLRGLKNDAVRLERAHSMITVLTLLTPGHAIMIPSVWVGGKIKSSFVRYYDNQHYGKNAEDDPTIAARHRIVDHEQRPTLLGAVVGRASTVAATQVVARFIGTPHNWLNSVGERFNNSWLKKFPGMDPIAETIGEEAGGIIARHLPKTNASINAFFRNRNYGWSEKQLRVMPTNADKPYDQVLQNFGRYYGQDVLYSAVTSLSIHPAINLLKRFVPGLTYTPSVAKRWEKTPTATHDTSRLAFDMQDDGQDTTKTTINQNQAPRTRVSDIAHTTTLHTPSPSLGAAS